MPKLSRRKRQLKEISSSRKTEDGEGSDNEEEEQEEVVEEPVAPSRGRKSAKDKAAAAAAAAKSSSTQSEAKEPLWVQCNTCDKWRLLPSTVDPESLPDIWTCDLNVYDPNRNSCDAAEESYGKEEDMKDLPLKSFFKLWVKKLKNADRAEAKMGAPAMTRNRKRKLDVEWIRCCNPSCGKWRAISRGIDTSAMLKKLNKNKRFGGEPLWFCSMNAWDDPTASCAAPQEPLWNCRWNLNR